jgi:NAD(P)-dependent dehydrogenase (short-subunit alcohol dehydrogenase family)
MSYRFEAELHQVTLTPADVPDRTVERAPPPRHLVGPADHATDRSGGVADHRTARRALAHSRGSKWCRDPQEQYASEFVQLSSMRTIVAAADVGNMILFLASDAAARISGEAIAVDGDLYYET